MRSYLVVVPPPLLDADSRIDAIPKPLQRQMLVTESAVERFVGRILPRLPWIDQRRVDARVGEPPQNGGGHELGSVVRTQKARGAVDAHQLREHLDDTARANAPGHIDRQALAGPFVHDGEALRVWPLAHVSKTKSYAHT